MSIKYDKIDWNSLVYYDETSPTALRWKVVRMAGSKGRALTSVGGIAGTRTGKRSVLCLDGTNYYVQIIVYTVCKGSVPEGLVVDHLDRNCLNNAIWNLEVKDDPTNNRNMKKNSRNTSGVTGVSLMVKGIHSYWVAYWVDIKLRAKCFNIVKLGYDEAFNMACQYRAKMIAELNAQGAGYTADHGT